MLFRRRISKRCRCLRGLLSAISPRRRGQGRLKKGCRISLSRSATRRAHRRIRSSAARKIRRDNRNRNCRLEGNPHQKTTFSSLLLGLSSTTSAVRRQIRSFIEERRHMSISHRVQAGDAAVSSSLGRKRLAAGARIRNGKRNESESVLCRVEETKCLSRGDCLRRDRLAADPGRIDSVSYV